ncbi:dynamin family protein [Belliella sp. DSM 107340]|uniref:Dynamin family protein n=1 Tax=Belliella calami TaxID=2923436 RepID=A0ABS9USG3_9BACT|nr:dynamin family protein [Belliella calami]MCH7399203.1 dynamin family protein [Belliella calami]
MNDLNIFKEFLEKKNSINNKLNHMVNLGFAPSTANGKEYTKEKINEIIKDLNDEHFTISVCGQINAGKSSLLNFLLFAEKTILPADDTPWTAKLSTIRYGEKTEAEVTYYSKSEWEELKNLKLKDEDSGESTTYFEKFLKKDVNNSALKGIYKDSFIHLENKVENGISLNELENYVTKPGVFTPFVKCVDIKVNNELCKGVVFVDTPGINDSNELRSKVTTDWISKSSAVIYLFYTGQPLSSADYDFIDIHLSSVPSDKIMFVITKADTSGDYQSAVNYVEQSIKNDPELQNRKLFSNGSKVYPISTYAALLNYKIKEGIGLTEDEEYHYDRLNDLNGDFIEKEGYIPDLINGIKSHLMEGKGISILNKGEQIIGDLGKTKINSIKIALNKKEDFERNISKSSEELEEKKKEIDETLAEIDKFQIAFKEERDNFNTKLETSILKHIRSMLDEVEKNTKRSLESIEGAKNSRKYVEWQYKDHLEKGFFALQEQLFELRIDKEANILLEKFEDDLSKVSKILKPEKIRYFVPKLISVQELIKEFSFSSLSDKSLLEKGAKVNIFNIRMDGFDGTIYNAIKSLSNNIKTQLIETLPVKFSNKLNDFFEKYTEVINKHLYEMKKSYSEIIELDGEHVSERKKIIEEIKSLHIELEKFEHEFKKITTNG